jgi:hypothetical protein
MLKTGPLRKLDWRQSRINKLPLFFWGKPQKNNKRQTIKTCLVMFIDPGSTWRSSVELVWTEAIRANSTKHLGPNYSTMAQMDGQLPEIVFEMSEMRHLSMGFVEIWYAPLTEHLSKANFRILQASSHRGIWDLDWWILAQWPSLEDQSDPLLQFRFNSKKSQTFHHQSTQHRWFSSTYL